MKYFIWWQNPGITEGVTRSYLENEESLIHFTLQKVYLKEEYF